MLANVLYRMEVSLMSKIFISYRRDDSADVTGRLCDRLAPLFDNVGLFKDVDNIPLGTDFRAVLRNAVEQCDLMLVVIGRQWIAVKDERRRRRLENPDDPVRIEVEVALARAIPVIPVLVQNATMPKESDLPKSMRALVSHHGIAVRADPYFHSDVDLLVDRLPLPEIPLLQALEHLEEEEFEEAIPLLQRATELDSNNVEAWTLLGSANYGAERYLDALRAFDRALALDATKEKTWDGRGDALRHLGRYDEALAAYDQALARNSTDTDAWDGKGKTFFMQQRYNEALLAFDRALVLDQADAVAWAYKGDTLSYLDRHREALATVRRSPP